MMPLVLKGIVKRNNEILDCSRRSDLKLNNTCNQNAYEE